MHIRFFVIILMLSLILSCDKSTGSTEPDVQVDNIEFLYCIGKDVYDSIKVISIDSSDTSTSPFVLNNSSNWYEVNYSDLFNTITPTRDLGNPNRVIGVVSGNNLDLSMIVLEYGYTSQMQKDTLEFYQCGDSIISEYCYGHHYYKNDLSNIEYLLFIAPLNMYMFTSFGGTIYCHVLQNSEKIMSEKMYVLTIE